MITEVIAQWLEYRHGIPLVMGSIPESVIFHVDFIHWNIHTLTPGNSHAIANSGDIGN